MVSPHRAWPPPGPAALTRYDKKRARYPGKSLDSSALTKFIMKKGLPLVGQKTWKSQERYDAAHLPIVTLFTKVDLEKNPKGYDYYANRLRRVAQVRTADPRSHPLAALLGCVPGYPGDDDA